MQPTTRSVNLEEALAAHVLDRGGAFVNVTHPDFGATPDVMVDNGPALEAAAAEGGLIWIPRGRYRLSTEIVFRNPVDVYFAEGAELVVEEGFEGPAVRILSSNVTVRNLSIAGQGFAEDGVLVAGTPENVLSDVILIGSDIRRCSRSGIRIDYTDNAAVRHCRVTGCGAGIRLRDCGNGSVTSCAVAGVIGKGIAVIQSPQCRVVSCSVHQTTGAVGDGIYVAYGRSVHVVVRDCFVDGTTGSGIKLSRRAHGTRVLGCTVRKADTGPPAAAGIVIQGARDSLIDGCWLSVGGRHGIVTGHHPDGTDGGPASGTTIRTTNVNEFGGASPAIGILGSEGDYLSVSDCTIVNARRGIHVSANEVTIGGCIIKAARAGISIEGAQGVVVDRCRIKTGEWGVQSFSQASKVTVSSCHIEGRLDSTGSGIEATGGGTVGRWVITGNTITGFRGGHGVSIQNGRERGAIISSNYISDCGAGIAVRERAVISSNYLSDIQREIITAPGDARLLGNSAP